MATQIIPRQQGDDYQARWFWLQACALLDEFSNVERVVYEDDELKSFDDVAVYYRAGYTDKNGNPLDVDFYQVKFHVTSNGAIKAESLCEPAFINAKKFSLLERIKNAYDYCYSKQINYRLILYTPWSIHPDDPLAEVHSNSNGRIIWTKLNVGGDRCKMGKIRKKWKEHLSLSDDNELMRVITHVHIKQGPSLDDLGRQLNWRLEAKGLKPVEENCLIHPYDDLTKKMLAANKNVLTAISLLAICKQEGLLIKTPTRPTNTTSLGIRSFIRWAEDLQNQTQSMICLSHYFDGRWIKNVNDWNNKIPNELCSFINNNITRGGSYRLHLDTHSSIAFLAGNLIPEKMGVNIEVVQHSNRGNSFWSFTNGQGPSSGSLEFIEQLCHHGATDYALAIGLTHNIKNDVLHYIQKSIPTVGFLELALPEAGPSPTSVTDGAHADSLANQIVQYIRSKDIGMTEEKRVHIFSAAPNGLIFCLGRKMQSIPCWTLYEYDFGSGKIGAYSSSIINYNGR